LQDAREALEHKRYDVVLCDNHFDNSDESGQDLLEELRREQMLPYSTVFIMVTGDATYQKVAEAAEAALDSYLIKPFSANTCSSASRKRASASVCSRTSLTRWSSTTICVPPNCAWNASSSRGLYWLYAARIGAELLLTLKRNDEAKRLFDAWWKPRPCPGHAWAWPACSWPTATW
jgi:CheY-like chemotaxis protein